VTRCPECGWPTRTWLHSWYKIERACAKCWHVYYERKMTAAEEALVAWATEYNRTCREREAANGGSGRP
jgi:hypothetical protein